MLDPDTNSGLYSNSTTAAVDDATTTVYTESKLWNLMPVIQTYNLLQNNNDCFALRK